MPRNTTEYEAIPIFPPEPDITFHVATGESLLFKVWQDRKSNAKLVKCDICGAFMPLSGAKRSPGALKNSVRKSGSVRFFGPISTDRNRNRLPIMADIR